MDLYEPELGQECFGQPYQVYDCPEYIVALLQYLEYEMEICHITNERNGSPFRNTGCAKISVGETFQVESYSWNEGVAQPWNFKYKDIEISWYKYLGRGTTINREVTPDEVVEMFESCLKAIWKEEKDDVSI